MAHRTKESKRDDRVSDPYIQVRNITKTYTNGRLPVEALEDVSFDVGRGECVAIVGPSGCGKTTLIKIMAGLITPTDGQIIVGGSLVTEPSRSNGIVLQEPALMPWRDTLSNVLLPAEIVGLDERTAMKRGRELIELMGLGRFESSYPHELSGGMQQRVALCRALIHNPSLLLLDEPFGALDAMTREQLNLELLKLLEYHRMTTVLVTHSITEAIFLADRVIVMGPRPGSTTGVVPVHFPRPRAPTTMDDGEFTIMARRVRGLINQHRH